MNQGGYNVKARAYLVADLDFNGPLPVVRQFCIFSSNPYHEPGLAQKRLWAVLMVREAGSFSAARDAIYAELESVPVNPVNGIILRLMDQAPDEATHALKYRLPQTLDAYISALPAPDHPFFRQQEA